tara:strand:- start:6382 stop:7242 length:861 start_codon:yes stop_codon:yes gene_type:complete
MIKRNIGIISEKDQEMLRKGRILICGVGGMGGVCAESLIRMGVENIKLADFDSFEDVNFNRQIYSNNETIGRKKVEVLKENLMKINKNANIKIFTEGVTKQNINELLRDIDIVVNGMDDMVPSLYLERNARKQGKTIVDAWLTPYASVFVIEKDSPHWEDYLDLPTKNMELEDIDEKIGLKAIEKEVKYTFSHFNPYRIINKEYLKDIVFKKKPRPSFAPVVWLSGVLMANEVYKVLCGLPNAGYRGIFYNQYTHEVKKGKVPLKIRLRILFKKLMDKFNFLIIRR